MDVNSFNFMNVTVTVNRSANFLENLSRQGFILIASQIQIISEIFVTIFMQLQKDSLVQCVVMLTLSNFFLFFIYFIITSGLSLYFDHCESRKIWLTSKNIKLLVYFLSYSFLKRHKKSLVQTENYSPVTSRKVHTLFRLDFKKRYPQIAIFQVVSSRN